MKHNNHGWCWFHLKKWRKQLLYFIFFGAVARLVSYFSIAGRASSMIVSSPALSGASAWHHLSICLSCIYIKRSIDIWSKSSFLQRINGISSYKVEFRWSIQYKWNFQLILAGIKYTLIIHWSLLIEWNCLWSRHNKME